MTGLVRRITVEFSSGEQLAIYPPGTRDTLENVRVDHSLNWMYLPPGQTGFRPAAGDRRDRKKESVVIEVRGEFQTVIAVAPPRSVKLLPCRECGADQGTFEVPR